MNGLSVSKVLIILAHAFVGWALCAATMGVGMSITTMQSTLITHAIGAPLFFFAVSLLYYSRFNYTTPFRTALIFVAFVIVVDFFLVALVINKSLQMFASLLGTWIPFALIFSSTYLTGLFVTRQSPTNIRTA